MTLTYSSLVIAMRIDRCDIHKAVSEQKMMVAERSALRPFCFPRTSGRRAVMASPRDRRSLRRQLAEDDDALEIQDNEYEDNGEGITKFLDSEEPGPGFSRKRIPTDRPQVEEKKKPQDGGRL